MKDVSHAVRRLGQKIAQYLVLICCIQVKGYEWKNANYPMIYNWGSIETFFQFKFKTIKCNLRDSLVPAAAVIPAQIVYIKVVAVKKSTLLKILLLYKKYFVD